MAFNKTDLDNIKSKILISSELEKKTKIIKKGKDIWCCCPFHNEKTPSCKINDDLGSFYCFGCGAKGDIFTIYQDLFNYTFLDAVKELSERAGVKINFDTKSDLKKNGNLCVVTFHSLEDRLVKNFLKIASQNDKINKVLKPSKEEIEYNSRSRSAKLRFYEKNNLEFGYVPIEDLGFKQS